MPNEIQPTPEIELVDFKLIKKLRLEKKHDADVKAEEAFQHPDFFGEKQLPPENMSLPSIELSDIKINRKKSVSYISLYTLDKRISKPRAYSPKARTYVASPEPQMIEHHQPPHPQGNKHR